MALIDLQTRAAERRRRLALPVLAVAASLMLSGCVTPVAGPKGLYATPLGNAPVTPNPPPYSAALVCLGDYARAHNVPSPRGAVGRGGGGAGGGGPGGGRGGARGAARGAGAARAGAGARRGGRGD